MLTLAYLLGRYVEKSEWLRAVKEQRRDFAWCLPRCRIAVVLVLEKLVERVTK